MEYNFEFMCQKNSGRLIGVIFFTFFIFLFGTLFLSAELRITGDLIFIICFVISISIPYIIFNSNKKRVKREGFAVINDSFTEFNLETIKTKINYFEIEEYQIQKNNGSNLYIKLKGGKHFILASSKVYCKTDEFDKFCNDFGISIEEFIVKNKILITKKKSFFDKRWLLPILIIITIALIVILIYALAFGKHIPIIRLFSAVGSLMAIWGIYFNAKKNQK